MARPNAPSAQFFDRRCLQLLLGAVDALLLVGVIAMAADRRRTLRDSPLASKLEDDDTAAKR